MEIKRAALIGTGAIGTVYATMLNSVDSLDFCVVAGGKRLERYRRDGFILNGVRHDFKLESPEENAGPCDLVIVSVKYPALDSAIVDIKGFIGPDTVILSIMNGIDSEERIGAVYGMEKMIYGFSILIDATRTAEGVLSTTPGTIVFGERSNIKTPRISAVKNLFDKSGIDSQVPHDIMRELWYKFLVNTGLNPIGAIAGANYGMFNEISELKSAAILLHREVISVANAMGIALSPGDIERALGIFDSISPVGRCSMLQDMDNGRETEIDMLCGAVMRLGEHYNIKTPCNELIFNLVRAFEKKSAL